MTYGFRPANWPAFQAELAKRDIAVSDIERFEIRPHGEPDIRKLSRTGLVEVTVTLRSGHIESWRQQERSDQVVDRGGSYGL